MNGGIMEPKLNKDVFFSNMEEIKSIEYQIGEKVMHPVEGACYVKGITMMKRGAEEKPYYKLIPLLNEKTIVYVPVFNNSANRIRPIMSMNEIDEISNELQNIEINWISDNRKRQEAFLTVIKSCDTVKITKIIILMLERELEKPLQSMDKDLLCKAQKLAYSEIAIVKGKTFDEVKQDIKNKVQIQ
jgi:RNA polymerase-interacting CarD/CdnL/TRCF family regulator